MTDINNNVMFSSEEGNKEKKRKKMEKLNRIVAGEEEQHVIPIKTSQQQQQQQQQQLIQPNSQTSTLATNYSVHEYMIKLTMFLVTIFCSQTLRTCNGQKHYFHQDTYPHLPYFSSSSSASLDQQLSSYNQHPHQHHHHQRQALNQLIYGKTHNLQNGHLQQYYHGGGQESQYKPLISAERHHLPDYPGRTADRRASSNVNSNINQIPTASSSSLPPGSQLVDNGNGKLLVCYYTDKQSPPYWPQDARGYVIPSDHSINSMIQQQFSPPSSSARSTGGNQQQVNEQQVRHESGFSPILQYDPFPLSSSNPQNPSRDSSSSSSSSMTNMKNQQQQLVFKSEIAIQHNGQSNHHGMQQQNSQVAASQSSISNSRLLSGASNSNNNNGLKSKQQNDDASQMLLDEKYRSASNQQQQQQYSSGGNQNNPLASQAQALIAAPGKDADELANSMQLIQPAYSILGSMDSALDSFSGGNNGLIVGTGAASSSNSLASASNVLQVAAGGGGGGSAMSLPGTVSASPFTLAHNGNNGNSFVNSAAATSGPNSGKLHGLPNFALSNNNNSPPLQSVAVTGEANLQSHPERLSAMKQTQPDQQLVFSPSLSRPFIVGTATVGNSTGLNANGIQAGSYQVLDTKSQLFIPPGVGHLSEQQQLYFPSQQQVSASNNANLHPLYQKQQQQQTHEVSAASVLKAKSLQVQSSNEHPNSLQNFVHQPPVSSAQFAGAVSSAPPVPLSPASSYRNQQQFSTQIGKNQQLLVPNGVHSTSGQSFNSQQVGKSASSSTSPLQATKAYYSAPNIHAGSGESLTPLKHYPSSPASAFTPATLPMSSSGVTSTGSSSQQHQQQVPSTSGLSSALVSSPFSTMFDVFGAASQYLMRFKPSSLISPSALVFNTITADQNSHLHRHPNSHQVPPSHSHAATKSSSNQTTLIPSASSSSASSLIPLPFSSSNLLANIQKSSTSSSSNERTLINSATGTGSNMLSRFSLQNSQHTREDVCGRTIQTPQRRIIGGEGARYGEFPYQVHIKIAKHQCGGALVDKQSIVTAAHCVYHFITRAPVSKLQIVIGAYDIEDEQYQELPPQYFKVNKVKLHPNFRFSASHPDRYDIAILKLDKPVKYTDNVLPVCLPSKDLKFESMVGTVTGFGKTDPSLSNRYGTRLLQKVDVPIIENNECERWHRTRGIDLKIFPEMMCAGYEDGLKDACVGDSGGPLVVKTSAGPNGAFKWTLAGITSAGFGCAQSRQPGIYHRVSNTVDWILENLD